MPKEWLGGSFLKGKTSNLELDVIYKNYLPPGSTLPCSTLPYLTAVSVKGIREKLKNKRRLFFPIFVRHHWIAGILRINGKGKEFLGFYDSAPSSLVHRDFKRSLVKVWPSLRFYEEPSARQARGSDDCGLFMTAAFFAVHLNETVAEPDTIGQRLRPFLAEAEKTSMDKLVFLQRIREIIVGKQGDILQGGNPKRVKVRDPFLQDTEEDSILSVDSNESQKSGPTERGTKILAPEVEDKVLETLSLPDEIIRTARSNILGHLMVATALANVADGQERSLKYNALRARTRRLEKEGKRPTSVVEALRCLGLFTMQWKERMAVLPPKPEAIFVYPEEGQHLPENMRNRMFVVGAIHASKRLAASEGVSPYPLSSNSSECEVGLYLDSSMRSYTPQKDKPAPPKKKRASRRQEAVVISDNDHESDTDEFAQILKKEPKYPLNENGSPDGEPVSCPRGWHIYSQIPPHVSAVAWNSITKDVRQHHIRCLHALKSMPHDLLQQNIASCVLECTRRDAVARGWGPSTVAKRYAAMAGALRDLPLYTTEKKGILLARYPEWRAAQTTIRRMERQMDPQAYPPVTWSQYQEALKGLRTRCPMAAVYLAMMWALAARAGDIDCLRRMDVTLKNETKGDGTVPLGVTQKFGKGTRFRGTYWPASNIPEEEAAELRKIMHSRKAKERLFSADADMRTIVRKALQSVNRKSALPSIRRGAIQHLAQQGLPEETLMRLTGHTRLETLYRYIGHGHPITPEAVAAQERVSRLHHPERSS